jgi:CO/xanthine dehydrogenase Mo-binding subunit
VQSISGSVFGRRQHPTAAAIVNAIANATGKRLRALPFAPERVKQALA